MTTVIRNNYARLSVVLLVSLLIASAWLVFPYLIQGKKLLSGVGDNARMTKAGHVSMYLTRYLVDHPKLELTATFATDEFFQYVDRVATIGNLRPDRNFIFFVNENIHEGKLAFDLPAVKLHIGDQVYEPDQSIGPNVAEHHRITVYSIPKRATYIHSSLGCAARPAGRAQVSCRHYADCNAGSWSWPLVIGADAVPVTARCHIRLHY
jgi:hypothetical protein